MTKIRVSKLVDIQGLIQSMTEKGIEGAEEFGTFLSEFSDQVIRGFRNGLSLVDNFYGTEVDVSLKDGVIQKVKNDPKLTPRHVFPSYVSSFENPVETFSWRLDSSQQIEVRANFLGSPSSTVTVRLVILY
jgi:hypothetical protein